MDGMHRKRRWPRAGSLGMYIDVALLRLFFALFHSIVNLRRCMRSEADWRLIIVVRRGCAASTRHMAHGRRASFIVMLTWQCRGKTHRRCKLAKMARYLCR